MSNPQPDPTWHPSLKELGVWLCTRDAPFDPYGDWQGAVQHYEFRSVVTINGIEWRRCKNCRLEYTVVLNDRRNLRIARGLDRFP